MHIFTVFCKAPWDKRGEYSDEIDVEVSSRSVARAKAAAQKVLDAEYLPGMKASRVEYRGQAVPGVTRVF